MEWTWWAIKDLNLGPLACEASALTTELIAHELNIILAGSTSRSDRDVEPARIIFSSWAISSVVRALASHARGPRFKSLIAHHVHSILPSFHGHLKTLAGYLCSKSGNTWDNTARARMCVRSVRGGHRQKSLCGNK